MKKRLLFGLCALALIPVGAVLTGCGHEHDLKLVAAKNATCTEAGHYAYYTCEGCDKYFDAQKNEISLESTVINKLGHDYRATYDATNYVYNNVCSRDSAHTVLLAAAGTSENYPYQISSAEVLTEVFEREFSGKTYMKLTEDINADVVISSGEEVVLDLKGHKLTNAASHTITNKGKLTLTDSSDEKTSLIDNITHKKAAIYNEAGAEIVVEYANATRSQENGKEQEASGGNSYYVMLNLGKATINDGHIYNDGSFSSLVENGWFTPSQNTAETFAELTINGGNFEGGKYTLKNDDYGKMTINGGSFQNKMPEGNTANPAGVILNWNELKITDGTFTANNSAYIFYSGTNGNAKYEKAVMDITGGIARGKALNALTSIMQGGTINGLENLDTSNFSTRLSVETNLAANVNATVNYLAENVYNNKTVLGTETTYNASQVKEKFAELEYYVKLGKVENVTSVNTLTLGEMTFAKDQEISLSIGNSNFIKDKVWYVENGDIYVSAVVVAFETKLNNTVKANSIVATINEDLASPLTYTRVAGKTNKVVATAKEGSTNEYDVTVSGGQTWLGFYYEGANEHDVVLTRKLYSFANGTKSISYGLTEVELDKDDAENPLAIYPIGWGVADVADAKYENYDNCKLNYDTYVVGHGLARMVLNISLAK